MYSFAQRPDCAVYDEPWYAHYLKKSGKEHPGRTEILASQSHNPQEVMAMLDSDSAKVVYVKNMAHHMACLPDNFLDGFKVIMLIRDPAQLIASFTKVIERPDMTDIAVELQYKYWKNKASLEAIPVIDAGLLLADPRKVISQICEILDIPFHEEMLSWKPGARLEDGVWARYWYAGVHNSTGFEMRPTQSPEVPAHCEDLLSRAKPLYEEMLESAIKP